MRAKTCSLIINSLRVLGLTDDDVELDLEPIAIKNVPATVSWYMEGFRLQYSYKACKKYVENLYVVSKIIEFEVKEIVEGRKTIEEFVNDFREESNVEDKRKEARELLGVKEGTLDLDAINKKYKQMSKEVHPDMPNGSTEKFKELNNAHKILKRELE